MEQEEKKDKIIELQSSLKFDVSRKTFKDAYKEYIDTQAENFYIEIRLTEVVGGKKAQIFMYSVEPKDYPREGIFTYIYFTAIKNELLEVSKYLESETGQATQLLHVFLGFAIPPPDPKKSENTAIEHVVAVVPSEGGNFFAYLSKGDRVPAKGQQVAT